MRKCPGKSETAWGPSPVPSLPCRNKFLALVLQKHTKTDIKDFGWRCLTLHNFFKGHCTKVKFFIKDFFSKCDQIGSFLRIWSHLLKKTLMENFIFCVVGTLMQILKFANISVLTIMKIIC